MVRIVLALSVVLLIAVIGYSQFNAAPSSARDAIEQGIESAKSATPLNAEEEALLRVQLALLDHSAKKGLAPESLAELVPEYFDTLPRNPVTKKPFKYARKGASYELGGQILSEKDSRGADLALLGEGFINPNTMEIKEFVYDPTDKRDPFQQFDFSKKAEYDGNLTPLERYGLGQLRLTAIVRDSQGNAQGIVEDAVGKGYTVRKGTKIGNNGGILVTIEEDSIKILETLIDFTGVETQKVQELKIQKTVGMQSKKGKRRR